MQHLCHLVFEIVTEKCEGQTLVKKQELSEDSALDYSTAYLSY